MAAPAIGVFLPTMSERSQPLPDMVAAARHAEDLGFESVWVVDQLIAGTGVPFIDSTVALGAAAGATSRIRLAYGVMILPLRPVVWTAKQVASLQQVSGGRLVFGVGVGGDRHTLSWEATGVPRRERGRRGRLVPPGRPPCRGRRLRPLTSHGTVARRRVGQGGPGGRAGWWPLQLAGTGADR